MKRVVFPVIATVLVAFPFIAFAGIAYIPHMAVNPPDAWGNPMVSTHVHVSNISEFAQTVTITYRNGNGTPLANQPCQYVISDYPALECSTDANGRIILNLPPLNSGGVSLIHNGVPHWGYGTIEGSINKGLVAHVLVNMPENFSVFGDMILNGGNPF